MQQPNEVFFRRLGWARCADPELYLGRLRGEVEIPKQILAGLSAYGQVATMPYSVRSSLKRRPPHSSHVT